MSILGNMAGCYSPMGKTFVLTDERGTELTGIIVGQETIFDVTPNDVREGRIYAGGEGIKIGEKNIPAYHTTTGIYAIPANSEFKIVIGNENRWDYTELQAMIMPYNSSMQDSVAVEKVVIQDKVYNVGSTTVIASVSKDAENKSISLGITNGSTPAVIRFFTYKEEI